MPTRLSDLSSSNLDSRLQRVSYWEQLMILEPNSTVQPETTFTLSHKRRRSYVHARVAIMRSNFEKQKIFDPPGSSNKTLSSSGLMSMLLSVLEIV